MLIVDGSDITKNYTTKAECIATGRDGSTGEYKLGYHTIEVTALTSKKCLYQCIKEFLPQRKTNLSVKLKKR